MSKSWRPATQLVHGGTTRSQHAETSEAIFLTQGFVYESSEAAEARFKGETDGFIYARYGSPTNDMFERRTELHGKLAVGHENKSDHRDLAFPDSFPVTRSLRHKTPFPAGRAGARYLDQTIPQRKRHPANDFVARISRDGGAGEAAHRESDPGHRLRGADRQHQARQHDAHDLDLHVIGHG